MIITKAKLQARYLLKVLQILILMLRLGARSGFESAHAMKHAHDGSSILTALTTSSETLLL